MTPKQEEILKKKIAQFKAEVGNRKLTPEQKKIYAAFTKTKGSSTFINVVDIYDDSIRLKIVSNSTDAGSQHILLKHYKTSIGRVTANEILNLTEIISKGRREKNRSYMVYSKIINNRGNIIKEVVRISKDGKTAMLKSFYSNR